ncbi:hypothetical protein B0T17DRAFT_573858 [Bombardia bombarda]|uniref:Pyrroloquinoline quinone-dependent pyranose dehydrogenase beta-propeller domain-containing protein n=1 Tax=Bombardia bombarda TaxID=252184 RepID=A0AA40C8C7_9PEZI|nr:hypothetical protein B0T17DRAFT_573858 [Bombardia bombarda]
MKKTNGVAAAVAAVALFASSAVGQTPSACSTVLVPTYSPPSVAPGWTAQLAVAGLTTPRSLLWDGAGGLLVVERTKGITRHTFTDYGGTCLIPDKTTLLVNNTRLNHGLALSADGKTLYASTVEAVFAWEYNERAGTVSDTPRTVVNNMTNNDIVTRTLLVSKKQPGMLLVSRGSSADENIVKAETVTNGLSQIRAFDLTRLTATSDPYDFSSSGDILGWGLRNSVGVGEHPVTGGIYAVENSIDGVTRNKQDIHETNPGEELNYLGFLNGTTKFPGPNFGYPRCFAVWNATEIPQNDGLNIGDQFAIDEDTLTDEVCAANFTAPRLTMPAHWAPLDIKFNADGSAAYISFHGSFDSTNPVGYRLSSVAFNPTTGDPVAAPDSAHDALTDILTNPASSVCPGACFRPAGLAFDNQGRIWMTSDSTGEIYVLEKSTSTPTSSASGTIVTTTGTPSSGAAGSGMLASWGQRVMGLTVAGVVGGVLAFY